MPDNYLVLARKYRPRNFKELIGQDYAKQTLINALERKKLHHGFLFTGTRGVGKTTIARILAKSFNCETGITSSPCGVCDSCKEITNGSAIDVIEIDAASNTQVEKMRTLLDSTQYTPSRSRFKIYIIDEVHMLSGSSFNALLKTLEEPPEHIKFIFATTDPAKLPITILSRCLQFNLQHLSITEISDNLAQILTTESLTFEQPALTKIAELGNGSMRDSLSILDQAIAFGDGNVSLDVVEQMLGIVDTHSTEELMDAIVHKDYPKAQSLINTAYKNGANILELIKTLASMFHSIALSHQIPSSEPKISQWASLLCAKEVQLYYHLLLSSLKEAEFATSDKHTIEMAILRIFALYEDEGDNKKESTKKKA